MSTNILGLDLHGLVSNSCSLYCFVTYTEYSIVTLHDEKRERPMLMPTPSLDDILPSVKEDYWTDARLNDEYLSSAYFQSVSSQLPKWAHSFARQAQSARLMSMVQDLLRNRFEDDPAGMRTKILKVDQLLQENMAKSLFDCNGNCTQHCGPISMSIRSVVRFNYMFSKC
jgi:hypothetical protein